MRVWRGLSLGVVAVLVGGCRVDGGEDGGLDGGGLCVAGHACNPRCASATECGTDEVCAGGVCGSAPPTAAQYASCSLDGDCPRGDYCKLSACGHDCLSDGDCASGTVCTSRGHCVAPEAINQPTAVQAPTKGEPQLSPTSLSFTDATKSTATVVLSNTGGEPFDFRVLSSSPAFSVTPFEGRVSGQPVTLTALVNHLTRLNSGLRTRAHPRRCGGRDS